MIMKIVKQFALGIIAVPFIVLVGLWIAFCGLGEIGIKEIA
jgi:hypothetical protein